MQVKEYHNCQALKNYIKRLTKLRIELLGEGHFSRVYQHPTLSNIAVKLVPAEDVKYLEFLNFVLKNQHNCWLPKIYFVSKHSTKSSCYYIVMMEKLKNISERNFTKWTCDELGVDPDELSRCDLKHLINNTDKDLSQVFSFMNRNFKFLDFHSGNVMLRGKQKVISDPVAYVR